MFFKSLCHKPKLGLTARPGDLANPLAHSPTKLYLYKASPPPNPTLPPSLFLPLPPSLPHLASDDLRSTVGAGTLG
jgi:hypothetical protein